MNSVKMYPLTSILMTSSSIGQSVDQSKRVKFLNIYFQCWMFVSVNACKHVYLCLLISSRTNPCVFASVVKNKKPAIQRDACCRPKCAIRCKMIGKKSHNRACLTSKVRHQDERTIKWKSEKTEIESSAARNSRRRRLWSQQVFEHKRWKM